MIDLCIEKDVKTSSCIHLGLNVVRKLTWHLRQDFNWKTVVWKEK